MYSSDEINLNNKKLKYSKSELVRSSMANYLRKRNFSNIQPVEITNQQFQVYSSIDNEIRNPNSIAYKSQNCDASIVDNNFTKFLNWLKNSSEDEVHSDLEQLTAPLFCHLYMSILQGNHPEEGLQFFHNHIETVEKMNKDSFVENLIKSLKENISEFSREEFRLNKFVVTLTENSKNKLMKFIEEYCHLIFLQILQTYFEIKVSGNEIVETTNDMVPNECCLASKFEKILNAASDLQNENKKQIFAIDVSNVVSEINCGVLSRYHGLFAYNQGNILSVHSIHPFNSLSCEKFANNVKLNGHSTKIYAVTISKHYLASASCDGKIFIYEINEFKPVKECEGHTRTIYCLKISSNELYLASGSEDNTTRLWNVSTGKFLRIFIGHEQAVTSLDFHPNCLYLITGSCDRNIRMWNIESGNSIRLFHSSNGTIRAVCFHPSGKYVISGGDDKYLRLWDILTGKVVIETKCKDSILCRLQWSKDGNLLCGTLLDKTVKIWNFKNLKTPEVLQMVNCSGSVLSVEYCFGTFGVLTSKSVQQS